MVRVMARPVWFQWDDHKWSESPRSHCPKEQRTDPSTVHRDGNVASGRLRPTETPTPEETPSFTTGRMSRGLLRFRVDVREPPREARAESGPRSQSSTGEDDEEEEEGEHR